MDTTDIAANILRLRQRRDLSQEAVAERAGMPRQRYRGIEKGAVVADAAEIRAVAQVLGASMREVFAPVTVLRQVRFRSLKRLKSRDAILSDVGAWLADYRDLEQRLGVEPRADALPALSEGRADPRAAAAAVRAAFGLSAREPVHDLCGLLEARGVKVKYVEVNNDAFLGLSVGRGDGGPAIIVNTWDRLAVEHWIYSAAHELGHLVLHLDAYDVAEAGEDRQQEAEAEQFASHFLMPDAAFWDEWRDTDGLALYDRVLKVKRVFRVSWRVVLFRVAALRDEAGRRRLWQEMAVQHERRTGRPLLKLTEPEAIPEAAFWPERMASVGAEPAGLDVHDFQSDRLAHLVRRAVEAEAITLSRAAEILGISLAEMRGRAAGWAV